MDVQKGLHYFLEHFFARKTQDLSLIALNMRSDIGMIFCTACEEIVVFHFNWQSGVSHLAIWVGPPARGPRQFAPESGELALDPSGRSDTIFVIWPIKKYSTGSPLPSILSERAEQRKWVSRVFTANRTLTVSS